MRYNKAIVIKLALAEFILIRIKVIKFKFKKSKMVFDSWNFLNLWNFVLSHSVKLNPRSRICQFYPVCEYTSLVLIVML